MRHYQPQKAKPIKTIISLVVLVSAILFVSFSPRFEREEPWVELPDPLHWNMRDPLNITLKDNIGLRDYSVTLALGEKELLLEEGSADGNRTLALVLSYPERILPRIEEATLHVRVRDTSLWRFFRGNETKLTLPMVLDHQPPVVNMIGHSYGIAPGGSAVVVFEAHDQHLKDVAIHTSNAERFEVVPFYQEGFYVALIARDVRERDFTAHVIALDQAGNRTRVRVPLFLKNVNYRQSNITLSERFLGGKIAELHYRYDASGRDEQMSDKDRFLFVNEVLRSANDELLTQITSEVPKERVSQFTIEPFTPLPNSAVVAHFGDRRDFYYQGERISHSYHLGLDMASVRQAEVFTSNPGTVVFVGDVGIYGNTPVIHHGLGLYSFYSHSTDLRVREGERVSAAQVVATTGVSGLALGDHLHFELRIQGVPVAPLEWMDRSWIRTNITQIIDEAKTTIDGRNH